MVEFLGVAVAGRTQSALVWAGLALVFMFLLDRYKLARTESRESNRGTFTIFLGLLRAQAVWSYSQVQYVLWPLISGTVGFLFPDPRLLVFVFNELAALDPLVSALVAGVIGSVVGILGVDLQVLGVDLVSPGYVVGLAGGVFVVVLGLRILSFVSDAGGGTT